MKNSAYRMVLVCCCVIAFPTSSAQAGGAFSLDLAHSKGLTELPYGERTARLRVLDNGSLSSLIGDAPGTPPAYVNAAACEWQLARERQETLSMISERAHERCLTLSFEFAASRFGMPPATTVDHPLSTLEWRYSEAASQLELMRDGGPFAHPVQTWMVIELCWKCDLAGDGG